MEQFSRSFDMDAWGTFKIISFQIQRMYFINWLRYSQIYNMAGTLHTPIHFLQTSMITSKDVKWTTMQLEYPILNYDIRQIAITIALSQTTTHSRPFFLCFQHIAHSLRQYRTGEA